MLDPILAEPAPAVGADEVAELSRRHFGLEGEVRPLTGERDANFVLRRDDGSRFVVKLAHPLEPYDETDLQSQVLLHLETTAPALPLPRIRRPLGTDALQVAVDPAAGPIRQMRAYSYLDGDPAQDATDGDLPRQLGGLAARLDQALVSFAHRADGRVIDWDLRRLPRLVSARSGPEVARIVEAYRRLGEPVLADLPDQVVHNDLNPHNVLVAGEPDGGGAIVGILDFGDLVRAPRVIEVGTAAAYHLNDPALGWSGALGVIRGYNAVSALTVEEIRILPVLIGARAALSVTINRENARINSHNAAYLMRNVGRSATALSMLDGLDLRAAGDDLVREVIDQ